MTEFQNNLKYDLEERTAKLLELNSKFEYSNVRNNFQNSNFQMTKTSKVKQFDLEDRTFNFAKGVREFLKKIPRTISNIEDGKQLARSSGSIGANYIEANESLSKKDFKLRIKICRKEAKESRYWLKLIGVGNNSEVKQEQQALITESTELMNIFGSIVRNLK